ncbi:MAG: HD domain-containing protein [Eubacterium sp.]|nr:HD domain-containing protein [Eubacterium sp.]
MESILTQLHLKMIRHNGNDPQRCQHTAKVHSYARLIGQMEELRDEMQFITEASAYLHDIGIRVAEEKYGEQNWELQEQLGPDAAREALAEFRLPEDVVERICYIIGHHHTFAAIDGIDFRILAEADYIVNAFEMGDASQIRTDEATKKRALSGLHSVFHTKSGKKILCEMFGIEE